MVYFLKFLVPDGESLIWRKAARVYIPLNESYGLFLKITDSENAR